MLPALLKGGLIVALTAIATKTWTDAWNSWKTGEDNDTSKAANSLFFKKDEKTGGTTDTFGTWFYNLKNKDELAEKDDASERTADNPYGNAAGNMDYDDSYSEPEKAKAITPVAPVKSAAVPKSTAQIQQVEAARTKAAELETTPPKAPAAPRSGPSTIVTNNQSTTAISGRQHPRNTNDTFNRTTERNYAR